MPAVGILAFQGDFSKHREAFEKLKCEVRLVKSAAQLSDCDYLVIPGGESTVIHRFIESAGLVEPICHFAQRKPVWGTCAGMILLARTITNDPTILPLDLLDITVERNGYGSQFESFIETGELSVNGTPEPLEMVFIRAPKITAVGPGIDVLGTCRGGSVIVRRQNVIATAFHPELTNTLRFQKYFLSMSS